MKQPVVPTAPQKERPSFAALMASVNERYPHAAYVGFAFWLAWSKMLWTAVSDCLPQSSLLDATMAYGARVHIVTNVALLLVIIGAAAFERRLRGIPERPGFLAAGAALATVGTAGTLLAIHAALPSPVFDLLCVAAGAGMGMVLVRCMLLLGALAPQRILFTVAACVSFSAMLSALSVSLPAPVTIAISCLLPVLAAAFLALGYFPPAGGAREGLVPHGASAARPPRAFWQFVFTVVLIAFVAESVVYLNNYGPATRAASIRHADIVVMLVSAALIVYAAVFPRSYNYGKMYYPIVFAIMVLLGLLFVGPGASVNLMLPLAAYQLFSMLIWCLAGYIAQQSKISPVAAFGFGYGAQMVGSVAGYLVGHQISVALAAWGVNLLVFYLIVAMMVLALSMAVYPPRAMRDLLLSIPDDDSREVSPPSNADAWERACSSVAASGALTAREAEVMALLARGRGSTYISQHLGVALATIYTHTRNIYRKLGVHSREELIQLVDRTARSTQG